MAEVMNADTRPSKKAAKCDRTFIDHEEAEHSRSFPGVKAVKFNFISGLPGQKELVMHLEELTPEMLMAAAAFGLNTSVGNTFGAIQDPSEAYQAACDRWDTLKDGEWSAERTTGPRVGDLVEALCRYLVQTGHTVDDAARANFKLKCGDEAKRKAWESDPRIIQHLTALKLERAEANARKAMEAAQSAGDGPPIAGLLDD